MPDDDKQQSDVDREREALKQAAENDRNNNSKSVKPEDMAQGD